MTGGPGLANRIEKEGYEWLKGSESKIA